MNPQLSDLASILADWINPAPGIPAIYLFGSRVRGDHRRDSDVDIRLFLDQWKAVGEATVAWWQEQNETDFAALKALLPGPPKLHREPTDGADHAIREGIKKPVLTLGRVVCVWTPPRGALTSSSGCTHHL
jgi:hypothetical protein